MEQDTKREDSQNSLTPVFKSPLGDVAPALAGQPQDLSKSTVHADGNKVNFDGNRVKADAKVNVKLRALTSESTGNTKVDDHSVQAGRDISGPVNTGSQTTVCAIL